MNLEACGTGFACGIACGFRTRCWKRMYGATGMLRESGVFVSLHAIFTYTIRIDTCNRSNVPSLQDNHDYQKFTGITNTLAHQYLQQHVTMQETKRASAY